MKLLGNSVYLDTLKREDCRKLYKDYEFDESCPAEIPVLGVSVECADDWYEEIQKLQGNTNIRVGIFLLDGTVIGDVALQDIDYKNRSCSIGIGIAKIKNRSNGYGSEAVRLILGYGFRFLPLERITANTADINIPCQSMLEHCGFKQEGRERKAMFLDGKWHDRYHFAILREEYETMC